MSTDTVRRALREPDPSGAWINAVTKRRVCYSALALLVCALLTLCGCAPGATTGAARPTATPTPPPTATRTPTETLLYASDWSHGLTDWNPSSGWTLHDDYLESDLSDRHTLTIPFQPPVGDYVVEYSVQVVDVSESAAFFQLLAPPQAGRDGYSAEIDGLVPPKSSTPSAQAQAAAFIDPPDGQATGGYHDYTPGTGWRVYRVEIHGGSIVFRANNRVIGTAGSNRTATLSNGPLRFACGLTVIRVKDFHILSLA